jgi:hypothetical protein
MISGYATAAATAEYAATHQPISYRELNRCGLHVSPAGFGCYRVSSGMEVHLQALRQALTKGINLIDTSANYADGKSEELVGEVLQALIHEGRIRRQAVVVVSKVGYLQGRNLELARQREMEGRGFPERVPYAEGLEHCIHPEFLADQLDRSLQRLGLECLDFYLLHNPEYYLGWAHKQKMALSSARREYYRRLETAFRHLEQEVDRGRIRGYGVSSNTFPAASADPQFTSLDTIWQIAGSISSRHRFQVIQFPMNLLEPGAAVIANQPGQQSLLAAARRKQLGVLINRPLNAITDQRLVRLADVPAAEPVPANQIEARIEALIDSERSLEHDVSARMPLSPEFRERLHQQMAVGASLAEHWRNFGDWQRWRQIKQQHLVPRVAGALEFLQQQDSGVLSDGIRDHRRKLDAALLAVDAVYLREHQQTVDAIRRAAARADSDWDRSTPTSRLALRALRSTAGVTTVLVGMRREEYVEDVLAEIREPVDLRRRTESWRRLHDQTLG